MKTVDAIKHFGSKAKLAKAIGINRSAVSQWGDTVPELSAFRIERETGGQLKANPDQPSLPAQAQ